MQQKNCINIKDVKAEMYLEMPCYIHPISGNNAIVKVLDVDVDIGKFSYEVIHYINEDELSSEKIFGVVTSVLERKMRVLSKSELVDILI